MIDNQKVFTEADCDFCKGNTTFKKVYDDVGHAWWFEGLNGSGSDHLAIWCGKCGPKHRENRTGFYFEKMAGTI